MSVTLAPSERIAGRYELVRRLGEGGMGSVWAAQHLVTRRQVALKFLKADDDEVRRRFLREARAATAVRHPNVVGIHDVQLEGDTLFMVMDLLEGETLGRRLTREGALALGETAAILLQVVSAVGTAHAVGIVHRDLKPENVFLTEIDRVVPTVKVLDFGIAKLTASEGDAAVTSGLTATGSVLGTPYYMAPEQVWGEKTVDHRADVWALGVIAWECLAGRRPIQGENVGQIYKAITLLPLPRLDEAVPDLPPDIVELVHRMLERDVALRMRDLREVHAVLRRYTAVGTKRFDAPGQSMPPPPLHAERAAGLERTASAIPEAPPLAATRHDATSGSSTATGALDTVGAATSSEIGGPAPRRARWPLALAATALAGIAAWALSQRAPAGPLLRPARSAPAPSAGWAARAVAQATSVTAAPVAPAPSDTAARAAPSSRPVRARPNAPATPSAVPERPAALPAVQPAPSGATERAMGGVIERPPF